MRTLIAGGAAVAAVAAGALVIVAPGGPARVPAPRTVYIKLPVGTPGCVPTELNRSAVLPGTGLAVAPLPDSLDASPSTQISLLGVPVSRVRHLTVIASHTGGHAGRLMGYSQGDGASFLPGRPFSAGETVTVVGDVAQAGVSQPFAFRFTVAERDPISTLPPGPTPAGSPGDVQAFHSRPDLRPPTVTVTAQSAGVSPGYVFAAPYSGPGQQGPMIFDDRGQLVWFDPLAYDTEATNLQVQRYRGKPVLTWWQGYIPPQGFGEGQDIVADSSYRPILHVKAGNGYPADLHEFDISPQGTTAYLTVFNPIRCDLSAVGGPSNAAVTDGVFQEIDLKTGLVRREWHSLDHVSLADSHQSVKGATTAWPWDAFHINTVNPDPDGGLLVSSRSTWAMYLVDPHTGQITTTVGGRHSSVTMGPGTSTAWQHDTRLRADGTITAFDNEAVPAVSSQSRGIVEQLDASANTVTLLHQYTHAAPLSAGSQGNFQTLAEGNVFLGWGPEPYFSEYAADGRLLFDAHMPAKTESYRGYRFAWTGAPAEPPAVAAIANAHGLTVYASWNGATDVAGWRVLAGPGADRLAPVAGGARSGFETTLPTSDPGPYVRVQALNASGAVIGTSPVVRA